MKYKLYKNSLNDIKQVAETVLLNRGITNPDTYLNLDSSCCNDYANLDNINDAVKVFDYHFCNQHLISILVDCDPDGYTSAAAMYNYIKRLNPSYPVQYIINKNNKSHGLGNMDKGDIKIPSGTRLLIIPDAGSNDIELMERTKNGRDINRHYYTAEEVEKEQSRPVVQKLKELMVLRNTHPAFSLDGTIEVSTDKDKLIITRKFGKESITLKANLTTYQFDIK